MTSVRGPDPDQTGVKLPLFPLPNVVHFPRTELRLHIFEPRYRRLVLDLLGRAASERWIGMVLLRPGSVGSAGDPPIFRAGTAGRMVEVEQLSDGRSNIVLDGGFRFEVESELGDRPYREATVRRIEEPVLAEGDPGVVAVRSELLAKARSLAAEIGESFPLPVELVRSLEEQSELESIVNAYAAHLDLPVLRKLELLGEPLPERALSLLGILRSRQKVLDLLRPYRHLARGAEVN